MTTVNELIESATPAPTNGTETSNAAARAIVPEAARQRKLVFEALVRAGINGLTDDEGVVATGLDSNSYRPRRVELVRKNLVYQRFTRRNTRTGRPAFVWAVKPHVLDRRAK